MEYYSEDIKKLVDEASTICTKTIAPLAAQTDAKAVWPRKQVKALGKLLGLHVPKSSGGLGQGLIALTALSERIAQACSSTAMCFVMHSVGTAVITAKATDVQKNKYLSTIAKGKHITSLALSEPGTGAHFYFPQTKLKTSRGGFAVSGIKEFITNGVYADSYVISTQTSQAIEGEFNCTGNKQAVGAIAMARVDAADTAISITNDAMTLTGGKAYAANSDMSRLLRDARASSVMAPTPGILRKWIGRDLVGLPMLGD
jgi:alkylation response protein AidB-like acyl-CoA dehydrogenase